MHEHKILFNTESQRTAWTVGLCVCKESQYTGRPAFSLLIQFDHLQYQIKKLSGYLVGSRVLTRNLLQMIIQLAGMKRRPLYTLLL